MEAKDASAIIQNIETWTPSSVENEVVGTITDYVPMVLANPRLSDLAHARIFHMVEAAGAEWEVDDYSGEREPTYRFFQDEVFGIDETIAKIVDYFNSGGRRLPVRKRILLLMGPVGGGKSTIVSMLKRGLGRYTSTDDGAVYALEGCPIHEDPLHVLPEDIRKQIYDQSKGKVFVEGELCPTCRKRMETEFGGDWRRFQIARVSFGEFHRKGIGTYTPSDPKSQDVSELIGSTNLAKVAEIGVESDPSAYQFDGEINISNRGLLEMIEMLKCDIKHLQVLLTVTQERLVKTPRFPMCYVDVCVVAHTNETEWNNFMAKRENEALQDRIITIPCPYVLTVSDEVRIYRKELESSEDCTGVAIAPLTLEVCAMFAVLSRLEAPKDAKVSLVKKMKAYDGQDVKDLRPADVRRMKRDAEREGMDGIGPRQVTDAISAAITMAKEQMEEMTDSEYSENCYGIERDSSEPIAVDAIDMFKILLRTIEHDPRHKDARSREKLRELIEAAREEFDDLLKRKVQRAFCYEFKDEAETLFRNYLRNVVAFCTEDQLRDDVTGDQRDPDERLMGSVEKMIKVGEGAAREFREGIMRRMAAATMHGKQFDISTYGELQDAVERRIFEDRKDTISITSTAKHPDPEQMKELNRVIRHLVEDGGEDGMIQFTTYTAAKAVRYVGKLLNR